MKLKDGFITHDLGTEQIMVGSGKTGFAGIVKSNPTAAWIIGQLKEDTSREKVLAAMLERYDVTSETAEQDLDRILGQLRSIGALDE